MQGADRDKKTYRSGWKRPEENALRKKKAEPSKLEVVNNRDLGLQQGNKEGKGSK